METQPYLDRIGYRGLLRPDPQVLRDLHAAHLYSVPFENLDVLRRIPIVLEESRLFDKIVLRKRGGFCYELNGLFAALLRQLGFTVTCLNARGVNEDGSLARDFDHLALLVECGGERWLADVGFGDTFVEPLRLDARGEQPEGLRGYRIDLEDGTYELSQHNYDGSWERQYRFDLQPCRYPDEFQEMCRYHQTSPLSPFPQKRLCTLALPDGRATLTDTRLILTRRGQRQEQAVSGPEEAGRILKEIFHMEA